MKNWNTDVAKFRTNEERNVWELVQKIEYGLDGEPLLKNVVLKYWNKIKHVIAPENRRLLEFYLWGKQYSLPTNSYFWSKSAKVK